MRKKQSLRQAVLQTLIVLVLAVPVTAQINENEEFGPVVRAYLGYLKSEQDVVDDRVSRREINATYYRRNSNRIRALRQVAVKIARESHNDYLPELEAVAGDEFGLLFEDPPRTGSLRAGDVLQTRFRYIGTVRSGELFYVFARLDPYEQSELLGHTTPGINSATAGTTPRVLTRARRVGDQP